MRIRIQASKLMATRISSAVFITLRLAAKSSFAEIRATAAWLRFTESPVLSAGGSPAAASCEDAWSNRSCERSRPCRAIADKSTPSLSAGDATRNPLAPRKCAESDRTTTVRLARRYGKLKGAKHLLEWRNWQTHGTQNPAPFTGHVGSTPTSSTITANAWLLVFRR
jgi:hypothetical protein